MYLLLVKGLDVPTGAQMLADAPSAGSGELLILGACTVVGYLLGRVVAIPGSQILAPMLVSAAAHIGGLVEAAPPAPLVAAAQVVIGAGIGVRFAGLKLSHAAWPLTFAVISAVAMLVGAAILAELASPFLGIGSYALLLALAPGGLAEMSMIALALGVDTAFIATMHVVRIMLVVSLAPVAFRLMGWGVKATAD
jgi:membrane AbrB-like protein